ncbi:MAG TPA: hypothetical protein VK003_11075, partial [Oceanobacillus sp.]|nr:hypothetical protein [Oceanobacillus sp.]
MGGEVHPFSQTPSYFIKPHSTVSLCETTFIFVVHSTLHFKEKTFMKPIQSLLQELGLPTQDRYDLPTSELRFP